MCYKHPLGTKKERKWHWKEKERVNSRESNVILNRMKEKWKEKNKENKIRGEKREEEKEEKEKKKKKESFKKMRFHLKYLNQLNKKKTTIFN